MFAMPFFTRAGTMIVESLSVGFSCNGGDFVVLPPQATSTPTRSPSTSSGESTSASDSSSSFYDADEEFDMIDDEDSGTDWESDSECSVFLRTSRRAHVTWQQAQQIRQLHFGSMVEMTDRLKHAIPHVRYQGASPDFSYQPNPQTTVPQTPVPEADDDFLDEIYSGYRHMTTLLDLDEVADLAGLQSPTQPTGHSNPDTSAQPNANPFFDFDCDFTAPPPPMSDLWIDPYGVPEGSWAEDLACYNVEPDSEGYSNACYILANSGLNFLTDYDISSSPRKCVFEISAILRRNELWTLQSEETIPVDHVLPWPQFLAKVRASEPLFSRFSYTSQWQPQTERARKTEGEPRSPKSMSPGFGVMFEA